MMKERLLLAAAMCSCGSNSRAWCKLHQSHGFDSRMQNVYIECSL